MRKSPVNPQQGRLFDPFEGLIPPLGLERIRHGWQGVFRTALLELMPAQQLGKHFSPNIGRHTKELYSVAGLLFLQEFQNWTIPQAVEAYLFHTDVQFALNLEPGRDDMCDRTFERYRALFLEDEGAGQVMQDVTDRLIDLLELDIAKQRLDSFPSGQPHLAGRGKLLPDYSSGRAWLWHGEAVDGTVGRNDSGGGCCGSGDAAV